jgi:hypothetical protein
MPTFIYQCPNTGYKVQGFVADDPECDEDAEQDAYEAVACTVCARVHLINPKTGKVAGE